MVRVREIQEELEGLAWFVGKGRRREEGLNAEVDVGISGGILCHRDICDRVLGVLLDDIFQACLQTTINELEL